MVLPHIGYSTQDFCHTYYFLEDRMVFTMLSMLMLWRFANRWEVWMDLYSWTRPRNLREPHKPRKTVDKKLFLHRVHILAYLVAPYTYCIIPFTWAFLFFHIGQTKNVTLWIVVIAFLGSYVSAVMNA